LSDSITSELKLALEAVENASIPDDLRSVAFSSAFWGARDLSLTFGEDPPAASALSLGTTSHKGEIATSAGSDSPGLGRLVQKLNVSEEDVEFVYEINDSDLGLRVPPSRLAPVLKDAVKQIIYLVAAGRQAYGFETKTSTREIKRVCAERGKSDTNFSRIVDALHGEGLIVGGSGTSKTIAANGDGFERAGEIVKRLRNSSD
jgi:hypothetical protein